MRAFVFENDTSLLVTTDQKNLPRSPGGEWRFTRHINDVTKELTAQEINWLKSEGFSDVGTHLVDLVQHPRKGWRGEAGQHPTACGEAAVRVHQMIAAGAHDARVMNSSATCRVNSPAEAVE